MSEPISILVATMSGTAEMVAEEVAGALNDHGRFARVARMEKVSVDVLRRGGLFLICSSTYGTGEVPDNGKPLYQSLLLERPDLSCVRYGVIALGDMTYSATFCGGGTRFDELLSSLGARRIGDKLKHDARSGIFPEALALKWLPGWMALVDQEDGAA